MEEKVFYDAPNVRVTSALVKLWDVSIPTRNISSVSIMSGFHAMQAVALFCVVVGGFFFVIGAGIGLVLIILGAVLYLVFRKSNGKTSLFVQTSSGGSEKIATRDRALAERIKTSIEDAIASRD
jgi:hypothetical protein